MREESPLGPSSPQRLSCSRRRPHIPTTVPRITSIQISPLAPLGRNDSETLGRNDSEAKGKNEREGAEWCERCFAALNMTGLALRIRCKTDRLTVILSFVHTVILSEAKDLLLY